MKKRMPAIIISAALAAIALSAAGCGSSHSSGGYSSNQSAMYEEAVEAPYAPASSGVYDSGAAYDFAKEAKAEAEYEEEIEEEIEAPEEATETGATEEAESLTKGRKLIYTSNLSVETEDVDALDQAIQQRVTELGGYIESSDVSGSRGETYSNRRSNYTIRIPAKKLNQFIDEVSEKTNVLSQSMSTEDITLQYVDMQSHVEALKAEQKRMLELLEKAESVEEIITIESHLTDIRYELEHYQSRLKIFDNQVDYSTIYLSVKEVRQFTDTTVPETDFERMTKGFRNSCKDLAEGVKDFFIGFVIALPFIALYAVIVAAIVLIIRAIAKKTSKKSAEKRAYYEAQRQAQMQQIRQAQMQQSQAGAPVQAPQEGTQGQAPQADAQFQVPPANVPSPLEKTQKPSKGFHFGKKKDKQD